MVGLAVAQVLLVGAGLVAVATHEDEEPAAGPTTTTTEQAAPVETTAAPETAVEAPVEETSTTAAPETTAPTTTAPPAAPTTTTAPSAPQDQGPPAVAAGTYTYDQTGSVSALGLSQPVPPTMTLVYSPAEGADQRAVTDSGSIGAGEEIRRRAADGVYLVRLTIQGPDGPVFIEPDPPALYAPWPLEPGREWSWSARLSDGSATVSQRSKTVRTESVTVGGTAVPTVVISSTIDIAGSGFNVSQTMHSWVSTAHALPVKTQSTISGTYNGIPLKGSTSSTLRSLTPA